MGSTGFREQSSVSYSRTSSEWTCRPPFISFIAYFFGFHLVMWVGIIVMSESFFYDVS